MNFKKTQQRYVKCSTLRQTKKKKIFDTSILI